MSSGTGYADNVYAALVDKWDNASGLSDKDMGEVYLVDGDGNSYEVPSWAMADEDSFLDWLDDLSEQMEIPSDAHDIDDWEHWWDEYDGFEVYTESFMAPVGYGESEE